jgi:hypothetical protein
MASCWRLLAGFALNTQWDLARAAVMLACCTQAACPMQRDPMVTRIAMG